MQNIKSRPGSTRDDGARKSRVVDTSPSLNAGSSSAGSSKDRKNIPLSCAECRRSKLKCDRTFPCQACVKRGCAALCPDGMLNATKGTKLLKSKVQRLNDQVSSMSAKIKELESALAAARLQLNAITDATEETDGREPNCQRGIRRRSYGDGSGTLAMDEEGISNYHGDTAQSEFLTGLIPGDGFSAVYCPLDIRELGLPLEILELFNSFPFGRRGNSCNKMAFLPYIPPLERVLQLTECYYQRFAWMCNAITRDDFNKEILHRIYRVSEFPTVDCIHPHRLAVFFAMMAIGASRSMESNAVQQAGKYYVLSCSALSLAPVVAEAMVATIQAFLLIDAFLYSSTRASAEEGWLLTGLNARLAFRIGLHRDGAQFRLDGEETQRRRVLFWELYLWDAWFSFVSGRAASIHLPDTDTKFPEDIRDSGLTGFHAWKYRYTAACLWPSVRFACKKEASYQCTINLDKKLRTFPIPTQLRSPFEGQPWSSDPASAMQQYCVIWGRELNLLFLHRNYVAVALVAEPQNPMSHKFGGSVMAAFRSVMRISAGLKQVYYLYPTLVSRVWFFWSGLFSACIVLAAIVIVSPMCGLATPALTELRIGCDLFEMGSEPCRHPKQLYLLKHLLGQAQRSFASYKEDPVNFEETRLKTPPNPPDELMILGGVAHGVIQHPCILESTSPDRGPTHLAGPTAATSLTDLPRAARQPIYQPTISSNDPRASPSAAFTWPDLSFDTNEFSFPSPPPNLPTYEDIMNTSEGCTAPSTSSNQDYGSFFQAVNMTGYVGASNALMGALHMSGQPQEAGSAMPPPEEGDSHEDVWRAFIGGLMNGQFDPSYLSSNHFF